jgi:glycosyltransferase involved in cell wall biosynthesis
MSISLVILTYNEIAGLKCIVDNIPFGDVDEYYAIDGGSTDGTVEFLQKNGIKVYGQKIKGRGEAFREAFRRSSCDACLFFSPDGNENPRDIPKFKKFLSKGADMVIATRMTKDARNEEDDNFFKWRKWANNIFTLLANFTWNKSEYITDTINGYRAITKNAWIIMSADGPGYTIEYQSSIRALKKNLSIIEFATNEGNRIDDQKGSPSIKTGIEFIRIYLKELLIGNKWKITDL